MEARSRRWNLSVAALLLLPVPACNESSRDSEARTGGASSGSGGTGSGMGGSATGGASGSMPSGGDSGAATGGAATGGAATGGVGMAGGGSGGVGAGGTGTSGGTAGNGGSSAGSGGASAGMSGMGGMSGAGGSTVDERDAHFRNWPPGAEPATVGKRVAEVFVAENPAEPKHYKVACAWYGSLGVAALLNEQAMLESLTTRYDSYENSWSSLLAGEGHVDENVFGIVPLELAKNSAASVYRQEGLALADHQQANIDSHKRFAIDDMFMITALQVQAYRVSRDAKYLNLAASVMVEYLTRLQQPDGLFFHHEDFQHRWARGNGWFAAGMAELMRELPQNHASFSAVRAGYEAMMSALRRYQLTSGTGAGLWKQIVDSSDSRNWPETSGSAMFVYALVTGVRAGWLEPDTYGPAARAGWLALVAKLDAAGRLEDVSDWAYKPESHPGGPTYAGDEEDYYFDRPKLTGDNHGQAPVLWSAAALGRPLAP